MKRAPIEPKKEFTEEEVYMQALAELIEEGIIKGELANIYLHNKKKAIEDFNALSPEEKAAIEEGLNDAKEGRTIENYDWRKKK